MKTDEIMLVSTNNQSFQMSDFEEVFHASMRRYMIKKFMLIK
jgi:hypothetical protein